MFLPPGHVVLRRLLPVFLLFILAGPSMAQSGKPFLKEGHALRKQQELERAAEKYGLAIAVEPGLIEAYRARAEVYTLLGRKDMAATDLRSAVAQRPSDAALAVDAADASMEVDSFTIARDLCEQALSRDPKSMRALLLLTRASLALNDLDRAVNASDRALALKATTDSHYMHALVRMAMRDYKTAEADLDQVLAWNHLYLPAYVALAETKLALHETYTAAAMRMRTLDQAVEKCTRALELDPQYTDALFTRSKAYAKLKEYAKSIDDISRCIALERTDRDVYMQRARYYHGYGQHQNAVNDLNRVVLEDPNDLEALLFRAECREANLDLDGALRDLDLAQRAVDQRGGNSDAQRQQIAASRDRIAGLLYEMNREGDPPVVNVVEPFRIGDLVQVSAALRHVKVSGYVRDKSLLKSITVNGVPADFAKDEKDPSFVVTIPFASTDKEIEVRATDVYDNFSTELLRVERSEGMAPVIALTTPKPGAARDVSIGAGATELFIEGTVQDASMIRLVTVNGVNASYASDRLDPDFSIKLDVKDKDRFTIRAEDQYGNTAEETFTIVRKAEAVAAVKPATPAPSNATGVTWLVHIENGDYRSFPGIQNGPAEAARMQKAFANYNVQRTIHKKNLTKQQMERLFNVELRDLVRTGKVNTILVWYSGHGRTVGGRAYWIPVDARPDDIYSFFNYGSLKAQMQNYSDSVNNTVVVSDAASGDPSFFDLTR